MVLLVAFVAAAAGGLVQVQFIGHEATQIFVQSRYIEVRAIGLGVATGLAHAEGELASVGGECPGVLARSPKTTAVSKLESELVLAVTLSFLKPLSEPIGGFAGAMLADHLRWYDPRLQRLVYAYVREQARVASDRESPHGLVALRIPSVCADARAAAASGYRVTPPATRHLTERVMKLFAGQESNIEDRLNRVLRGHTTPPEARLLLRIAGIEGARDRLVGSRLRAALEAGGKAMGAHQPLGSRLPFPRAAWAHRLVGG
jgi:hypothetical protein